jgi:hypothetical protein
MTYFKLYFTLPGGLRGCNSGISLAEIPDNSCAISSASVSGHFGVIDARNFGHDTQN